jgi:hypothetical protein
MISVKEIVTHYLATKAAKDWGGHDRGNTVGASEIGQCARRTWFTKNEVPYDSDYIERRGASERGNIIENHLFVPALRQCLPESVELLYAGDDQRTIVDGYLSATSDAVLVGATRDCLSWIGVPDIGPSRCIVIDCKSLDPRVDIKEAKAANVFQVQTQIGLLRACTPYAPDYALIPYIDASFLDEVTEFAVKYDPAIYQAAQDRARQIMIARDAASLRPEGKMAGGRECGYCAWASHCAHVTVSNMPPDEKPALDHVEVETLFELVEREHWYNIQVDAFEKEHVMAKQQIKEFLTAHKIRRYHNDEFSVAWSSTKGRVTVDIAEAEAHGIDLKPYRKEGDPGERLTVKVK